MTIPAKCGKYAICQRLRINEDIGENAQLRKLATLYDN